MEHDIEQRLKDAFDEVHADDMLVEKTKAQVIAQMQRQPVAEAACKPKRRLVRRLVPLAACLLLACVFAFGGHQVYFTPAAAISVDVNPSIELGVNQFDRVISVDAYNSDGEQLASTLDVKNMGYEQAVEKILEDPVIERMMARGEDLTFSVASDDGARSSSMLSVLESCTSGYKNTSCHEVSSEEVDVAHECGLSFGKYCAFLEAQNYDSSLTVDDAQNMTMNELHDCIEGHGGAGAQHERAHHGGTSTKSQSASSSSQGRQGHDDDGRGRSGHEGGRHGSGHE